MSLAGQIPNEVRNLHGLLVLDLSDNSLDGKIPRDIGQMTQMTFLDNLNLSFNDLSGRIPGLCGRPPPNKCPGDEDSGVPPVGESDGDGESTNELQRWFYIRGATGFATAFWIACKGGSIDCKIPKGCMCIV
nr:hypothetical protein [Tanacetum cinerariifolium]